MNWHNKRVKGDARTSRALRGRYTEMAAPALKQKQALV
ncbi:hypothetical protein SAMN05443545_104296 [Aidingimonas halophila]|uniref:Uncharacterized protein n=1 Tax=Aidingimonas halophila TaxID=574349 RepID=A0A1H2ZZC7_9GAMM|nr:hypothetical protein SAMN05443545_104296 [Aidingimonas halophila]